MQIGESQRCVGGVVAALAVVALGLWWSLREEPGDASAARNPPVPATADTRGHRDGDPGADDPAAELVRARRPGVVPRGVTPTPSYDMPRGSAIDAVAALQPRAEAGDNDAAFYLFLKIEGCRYQLYHGAASNSRQAPNADDSVESQLIARTPSECHGLTLEQYQNNVRWLEQAADGGIPMAQISYAGNAEAVVGNSSQMLANPEKVTAYRNKAMQYLRQATANGSVSALHSLGDAYNYGVLVSHDPIRAYAYAYAEGLALPQYAQPRLDAYASRLNPTQLSLATEQGRRIYDACCKP